MAAAPPAINNNSNNATMNAATAPAKPTTLAAVAANLSHRTDTPPKSQRGHNKPKCKQCGNVARSRCPFESCKSCCSKNQNPCHIHVLKANSVPEKSPYSGAASLDQQSSEPSPSSNASSRVASLRQLSNSFAQFNNLHISLRSRKPLTRKDAAAINQWRFSKLKEYTERNIEVENEAFDRYMQNVDLLEEVLSVKSMEDNAFESNPTLTCNSEIMIPGLKLQIRSNPTRSDSMRKRIQQIVDDGLKKLQNCALEGHKEEPNNASKRPRILRTERLSAISDLTDKINKARIEEDLKFCLEIKSQLFNLDKISSKTEIEGNEAVKVQAAESELAPAKEVDYSFPNPVGVAEIDQETLNTIDEHFCSLEHVEKL